MVKTRSRYKKVKSLFGKYERVLEDWDLKKLEKVGKIIGGGTPDSTNVAYWNGEILWAIPTDITKLQTNQIENTERKITKEGLDNSSANLLPKGTILVTSRATIGECAIATKPISTNQGFQSIICDNNNFDRMYIFYSIKYHKNELLRLAYGTTFLEINKSELKKIMFSIPSSILEQQKIASILSGVDALIESTQKVVEKTERLKKGLMQNLLTKGIGHTKFKKIKSLFGKHKIPEEWDFLELGKHCTFFVPMRNKPKKFDGYIPWLRIEDLDGKFVSDTKSGQYVTSNTVKEMKLRIYPIGTILCSCSATIGVCAITKRELITNQTFIGIFPNCRINNEYLYYYLSTQKNNLIKIGSGSTILYISRKKFEEFPINLPLIQEQQKIASILSGVDAYIQKNQQYKERLEKLKKGLMQKLLTGQIRVKV